MSDNNRDQLIDPSILDTSGADDGDGIPSFLRRAHNEAPTGGTHTLMQAAGNTTESHEPTREDDEAELAAMDEQEETTSALTPPENHAPAPSHAPIGHNAPPPSPEEMKKDFFKDLKSYGKQSGLGSAALPRLALRVIRAAADGLISLDKPVAGSGNKDDAALIYEAYTAEDSKHAEHTAGGAKANASKLRQLIALGCMTTVDGVVVADRAVALREELEGAELKPKPLYAGLVDVARKQIDTDTMLTDDAIKEALTKTAAEKTVEKEWAKVKKTVEGLVSGENAHGLKDQSPEAVQIQELVSAYVASFGVADQKSKLVAALVDQGYSEDRAYEIVHGA
jgi:hypothetical protein